MSRHKPDSKAAGPAAGGPDDLYPFLMDWVFGGFLRAAPDFLRALDDFAGDMRIVDEALTFTVPALFDFVRALYELQEGGSVAADKRAYLRFRKCLYGNRTNRRLKALGGQVEIATPHPNHDRRVYRLVRGKQAG